ncbi:MAG TPA: ArsB/NhaD family transporter [Syntrophorhabdaceae bacterium]|nr:ArsB/NhaD family transporter [Syntrophorhabdaceae bacterium]
MTQEVAATTRQIATGHAFWIATAVFLLAYALIIYEKIHKTIIALFGAALLIVLGIVTQEEAFSSVDIGIDWNVMFLLISMMVIINIMKPTGAFEYLAIKSAKIAKGRPFLILAIFASVTAVVSAFLDNVTTVLLIAPVTVLICKDLKLDVVPFLITEALASNIGGTATLIGDPPNIMIGSKAQLGFMPFVHHLTPVIILVMIAFIVTIKFVFGRRFVVHEDQRASVMAMNEKEAIKDPVLLKKSVAVLAVTITGFVIHETLGLQPATVALFGASLLLLISGIKRPHHLFAQAEWSALFFFMGLFIIIGAVVKVGLIQWMSIQVLALTQGNLLGTSMIVLWFSAFASAFIDNIPYVATMNPLIINMAHQLWPNLSGTALLHHPDLMPMWWSLSLGACLGGNGTAIGASANVVVVGIAEQMGRPISFKRFMLYGMPLMIESVIICALYIWLRYYVFRV